MSPLTRAKSQNSCVPLTKHCRTVLQSMSLWLESICQRWFGFLTLYKRLNLDSVSPSNGTVDRINSLQCFPNSPSRDVYISRSQGSTYVLRTQDKRTTHASARTACFIIFLVFYKHALHGWSISTLLSTYLILRWGPYQLIAPSQTNLSGCLIPRLKQQI